MNVHPCPVEEYGELCGRPFFARGLCKKHYERQRKTGSVFNSARQRGTTEQRFWRLVEKTETCWFWKGRLDRYGYGRFDFRYKPQLAHRMSWFLTHGTWSNPSLSLDHECHNEDETCFDGPSCRHRRCVNPNHLAEKTRAENVRAGRPGDRLRSLA